MIVDKENEKTFTDDQFYEQIEEAILCGNLCELNAVLKEQKKLKKEMIKNLKDNSLNMLDPVYFSIFYNEESCALLLIKHGFPFDIKHHEDMTAEQLAHKKKLQHFLYGLSLKFSSSDKDKKMFKESLEAELKGLILIKSNDPHEISKIAYNANPQVDRFGNTLLHLSAEEESVSSLISVATYSVIGINVNLQNKNGDTALHLAAKKGLFEMCRTLLMCGVNPLIRDKLGLAAVDYVSQNPSLVELLESHSPGLTEGILRSDYRSVSKALDFWTNVHSHSFENGQTAYDYCNTTLPRNKKTIGIVKRVDKEAVFLDLFHNILANNTEGVKLLIRRLTSVTVSSALKYQHPETGLTLLGAAVRNCNLFLIKELVRLGAPVRNLRMYNEPLVHFAITSGCSYTSLAELLTAGADAAARNTEGLTLIHRCIKSGISADHFKDLFTKNRENIIYLAERLPRSANYLTPRQYAKEIGRSDIVDTIDSIIQSLFKDFKNRSTKEILMQLAVRFYGTENFVEAKDDESVKKEFLKKLSNIEGSCKELFLAIHENSMDRMKIYNEVDYRDVNGYTALIKAIVLMRMDMAVWILAERPTLAFLADNEGLTPLHFAYSLPEEESSRYVTIILGKACGGEPNEALENAADMYGRLPCSLRTVRDTDERIAHSLERVRRLGPHGFAV